MRLMLSCVGRRVELIQAFVRAAEVLEIDLEIHGADRTDLAPGLHYCHRRHRVPPIKEDSYIPALLDLVRSQKIDLLVPLLDHELGKLSESRDAFEALGCRLIISAPDVVEMCRDKLLSYRHFTDHNIDTPATWPAEELLQADRLAFPYFMKPRFGSAGLGNYRLDDLDTMRALARHVPHPIVQEFVEGVEHTVDAYTGLDGRFRCALPRRRLEVRGGEVSKSKLVMDSQLIEVAAEVINSRPGWMGVVTIQCIKTPDGRVRVIEVNPRFGGGVPLSIRAGADFPRWLLTELAGQVPEIRQETFRDGLSMLRYDQSVFVDAAGHTLDPRL
jgi:carbamoyl-phosphate synthase large subunit